EGLLHSPSQHNFSSFHYYNGRKKNNWTGKSRFDLKPHAPTKDPHFLSTYQMRRFLQDPQVNSHPNLLLKSFSAAHPSPDYYNYQQTKRNHLKVGKFGEDPAY